MTALAADQAPSYFQTSESLSHGINFEETIPDLDISGGSDDEDFIALAQASSNRKASNLKGRSVKKGGGFQAMGLNANLLKAITRKGFSVPTPIQRKCVPLVMSGLDVVGMARTGSGKTAAFVIPMIERLKSHTAKVGARALVLSPSRELALQTLKVVKELGHGTDLRYVLLVGGDSLEDQFSSMATHPDVVIATPGRFLHLQVEMGLDLSSIQYVVFDEADRLFEMGFAAQLTEILHALPQSRQTLLFSATLPRSLVEFAKAGLQEPNLVRLDSESKISPDLQSAFFSVKHVDKDGALLYILQDVICLPTGETEVARRTKDSRAKAGQKRKRGTAGDVNPKETPSKYSTIIFAATKYHVDHIVCLLQLAGYAVSFVYGSLDQTARKIQIENFRNAMTHILAVTDVAARGIDIPVLANVINYSLPAQPKAFVHRVGRTARAGQRGWSYSLVRNSDVPYLLDLQLFLGRRLLVGRCRDQHYTHAEDLIVGTLPRDGIASASEWVNKMAEEDDNLGNLRKVSGRAEKQYVKTRGSASSQSAKRARAVLSRDDWNELHPLFEEKDKESELQREKMLARISGFRPQETIFEIGRRGDEGVASTVIKKRRKEMEARKQRDSARAGASDIEGRDGNESRVTVQVNAAEKDDVESSSSAGFSADSDIEVTFSNKSSAKRPSTGRNASAYMTYTPRTGNPVEDRGYSVQDGNASFATAARTATFDVAPDEPHAGFGEAARKGLRWDKRGKKYVPHADDEKKGKKSAAGRMVRSESGGMVPASLKSGRFEAWKKAKRIGRLPRVGENESRADVATVVGGKGGRRFKHVGEKAPKQPDKYRDDYHKKRKKVEAAKESRTGVFKDGQGKRELRGVDMVMKERKAKAKRKEKTGRPSKRR